MIEACLALPIVSVAFVSLLYLTYHGLIYFYTSYQLEETLFCMSQPSQIQVCRRNFQRKLTAALLFNEKALLTFKTDRRQVSGRVEIDLRQRIIIEKTLLLPLEKNL